MTLLLTNEEVEKLVTVSVLVPASVSNATRAKLLTKPVQENPATYISPVLCAKNSSKSVGPSQLTTEKKR